MQIRIIGNTKIDFAGKRKIAFMFSGALVLVGLFALVTLSLGNGNLGIQFIGGTMIEGYFESAADVGDLRSALAGGGFGEAEIQQLHGRVQPNTYVIRIKSDPVAGTRTSQAVLEVIKKSFPGNAFHMDSVHEVGPAVGKTLQGQARWAILVSMLGILAYITVRFDFRFGVAATIATFHDILAVLGIMYLMNVEVTILLITALLTLAGYSLTDTVIVYDRIRENLKKFHKRGDFIPAINTSINEVLSRTILTSGTTLAVLIALFVVGGPVLRDFSMALIFGVVIGTYSSWFVAAPIYIEWETRKPKRFKA